MNCRKSQSHFPDCRVAAQTIHQSFRLCGRNLNSSLGYIHSHSPAYCFVIQIPNCDTMEEDKPRSTGPIVAPFASHEDTRFRDPGHISNEKSDYNVIADNTRSTYPTWIHVDAKAGYRELFANNENYGVKLQSTIKLLSAAWVTAGFSTIWIIFTLIFVYNCSLPTPFSNSLLPSKSQDTLLILNILSHGIVLLLGMLTIQAFEATRWRLASSRKGIPAGSFLCLSRATGVPGILELFRGGNWADFLKVGGLQFWGIQRYPTIKSIN